MVAGFSGHGNSIHKKNNSDTIQHITKGIHTLLKGISLEVNIVTRLEFELANHNVTVQYVSNNTTETLPLRGGVVVLVIIIIMMILQTAIFILATVFFTFFRCLLLYLVTFQEFIFLLDFLFSFVSYLWLFTFSIFFLL